MRIQKLLNSNNVLFSDDEIEAFVSYCEAIRDLVESGYSSKIFNSSHVFSYVIGDWPELLVLVTSCDMNGVFLQ